MNISDVKIDYDRFEGKPLGQVVFEKQQDLMNLYGVPKIDLDVPKDQQLIRAMAWSVVEEAGEAMEVHQGSKDKEHLIDEVADMMHFYVEFLIMSGLKFEDIGQKDIEDKFSDPEHALSEFVIALALAVNVLKNRFWRETNLKTDQNRYREAVLKIDAKFWNFIWSLGLREGQAIDGYLRKNEVNLFRIRSKY